MRKMEPPQNLDADLNIGNSADENRFLIFILADAVSGIRAG